MQCDREFAAFDTSGAPAGSECGENPTLCGKEWRECLNPFDACPFEADEWGPVNPTLAVVAAFR